MRNIWKEITTLIFEYFSSLLAFNLFHQTLKGFIAFHNTWLCKLSKRHLISIVSDLFHLAVDHLHIKYEADELLDFGVKSTLNLIFLILIRRGRFLFFLFGLLLVVHFDDCIISCTRFCTEFCIVLSDRTSHWHRSSLGLLSNYSYSSPSRKEIIVVWIGLWLKNLKDVEFVVVLWHVCLI